MSKRKVKCKHCTNELMQDNAYLHINDKDKKEYYCSQEHYQKHIDDKESRKIILETCNEIFNLKVSMDSLFLKELKIFLETTDKKVVAQYLKDNVLEIDMAMNDKNFNSLNFKIKYFFAIVRKNIDIYKKIVADERKEDFFNQLEIIENVKFVPRKKKKTILEIIKNKQI